jgi:hypothetical protein
MSKVCDPSLLVVQVQSEQQHGGPDRQRCSITQVTEPADQLRRAGAAQDAVDGSDHAGSGEQRLRWRGPAARWWLPPPDTGIGLGRVEELAGLGDQATL